MITVTQAQNIVELRLPIDFTSTGRTEAVSAIQLDDRRYRLLASPALAGGYAVGDEVIRSATGYQLLKRSGNVAVQIFLKKLINESDLQSLKEITSNAGGALDGWNNGNIGCVLVINFPITIGFPTMETAVEMIGRQYPIETWMYANVYDTDGVTLLNWWLTE